MHKKSYFEHIHCTCFLNSPFDVRAAKYSSQDASSPSLKHIMRNNTFYEILQMLEVSENDLHEFTPLLKGWSAYIFVLTTLMVCKITMVVQRAVFLTFRKMGSRHINIIIHPCLILLNINMPMYALVVICRALYYPIKDLTGTVACYCITYLELFSLFLAQFQTFFITVYRYICLFHDQFLINMDLHPRVLAKIVVSILFTVSISTSFFILFGSEPTFTEQSCLGNYVLLYDRKGHQLCNAGSILSIWACKLSFVIYITLSSNLPEALLLYKCFQKIQVQIERVQSMIDEASYHRRRR